ncbi:MAG TPA: thrombospondin type 3 repeat-containing protein [Polyangiaceae bacterium]
MRARIGLSSFACLAALACLFAAPPAHATNCSGIHSTCIDSDTLWPHAGPARFVAVGSTETVAPGQIGFGLASTYLHGPIILSTPLSGSTSMQQYAVKDQVDGSFLWSYGVTRRLELDLVVPLTFGQGGTGLAPVTGGDGLKDTAVRDMRFGLAYALLPHARLPDEATRDSFGLVGRFEVSAPTGDSDQFAGNGYGVYVPSLAGDWRHGRFMVGVEVGARLRPTNELYGARIGSQLVTAAGVAYDLLSKRELLTASLEAWALPTFAEQHAITEPTAGTYVSTPDGKTITPAEWQVGVRTAPLTSGSGDLSIQASGGGGIPLSSEAAITTPKFRFTLGVRWAPLGRPKRGAGAGASEGASASASTGAGAGEAGVELHLSAAKDVCTSDPEVVDGFNDTDGCPDEDQDKDGIPDRLDKCPLVPEDFAGMTDGCPEAKK